MILLLHTNLINIYYMVAIGISALHRTKNAKWQLYETYLLE